MQKSHAKKCKKMQKSKKVFICKIESEKKSNVKKCKQMGLISLAFLQCKTIMQKMQKYAKQDLVLHLMQHYLNVKPAHPTPKTTVSVIATTDKKL